MDDWDEFPDDDWSDDDGETLVVPCSNCGADVYEDSEQCPVCGDYIVHDSRAWSGKPLWWILLGLAGVVAVILLFSGLLAP